MKIFYVIDLNELDLYLIWVFMAITFKVKRLKFALRDVHHKSTLHPPFFLSFVFININISKMSDQKTQSIEISEL